jgi:hypothetical protein
VVPGFLGNQLKHLGYLRPTMRELRKLGADAELAQINTAGSTAKNAAALKKQIQDLGARTGKPVRIIAHSKGVTDSVAALSLYRAELAPHVDGMVAIQGAYRGSPLADAFDRHPWAKRVAGRLLRSWPFRGDPRAIDDLTSRVRDAFNQDNPFPADLFPTLAVATSRLSVRSLFMFPLQWVTKRLLGERSDGLVSPERARIPGATVVTLGDMDHAESTMTGVPLLRNYSARRTTRALLTLFHEQSQARNEVTKSTNTAARAGRGSKSR